MDFKSVEDFDFFENTRKLHLQNLKKEKTAADRKRRTKQREDALVWRHGGVQAVKSLDHTMQSMSRMLVPHQKKKENDYHLVEVFRRFLSSRIIPSSSPGYIYLVLTQIFDQIKPPGRRYTIRTNIIEHRFKVLHQIRYNFVIQNPVRATYFRPHSELRVLRHLFRLYMLSVRVDRAERLKLEKLRKRYRSAKTKLDLIHKTMGNCQSILNCDSINHDNFRGCPKCGVMYRGGELDKTMYVTSVSRDTGVKTLVTLDFEMETLVNEDTVQTQKVKKLEEELFPFEKKLYESVVLEIQRWLCYAMAFKRFLKTHKLMQKSLRRKRFRSMVNLKREVDALIRKPEPIDIHHFRYRYSDIKQEVTEHLNTAIARKKERLHAAAVRFRDNLKTCVDLTRSRLHLERLIAEELAELERMKEKPIVLKRVPLEPKNKRNLVCFRTECKLRTFISLDRYETHMKQHRVEDSKKKEKQILCKEMKKVREADEVIFLSKLRESRAFILNDDDPMEVRLTHSMDKKASSGGSGVVGMAKSTEGSALMNAMDLSRGIDSAVFGTTFPSFRIDHTIASDSKSRSTIASLFPSKSSDGSGSRSTLEFLSPLPHIYSVFNSNNAPLFFLELVSKQEEVRIPLRLPLDRPVVRIGTHDSCECLVELSGVARKEAKIAKVHCMIYCSMDGGGKSSDASLGEETPSAIAVDNSTLWGTYMVTVAGTRKVPPKLSAGLPLTAGSLICLAVQKDGPQILSATDANGACAVYRVRCLDKEQKR